MRVCEFLCIPYNQRHKYKAIIKKEVINKNLCVTKTNVICSFSYVDTNFEKSDLSVKSRAFKVGVRMELKSEHKKGRR